MQGVPGIIASLALTKTLALICDIRKGRLSDVPAHLKLLIKLLQSGCLGKCCTCSCPWHRRRLRNTGQHMQCVLPGVGPYLVSPHSFSWSAVTFFQGSKYQAEEQANRGAAEACHFYSSICDPDPSSEGDWDTSVCICIYICVCVCTYDNNKKNNNNNVYTYT
jgi:hypothetical protein